MKGSTWRPWAVLVSILFALYLLTPTLLRYTTGKPISKVPKADDPWYHHFLPSEALKLGLDLVGGLHLVLGLDMDEIRTDAARKLSQQMKELAEQEKISDLQFEVLNNQQIVVKFSKNEAWKKLEALVAKNLGEQVDFVAQTDSSATLKMSEVYLKDVRDRSIEQALETLRNRIDEFGIAEPIITRQGDEKILVQFPGVQETARLKEIISRTARLSFHIERSGSEEPEGPPTEEVLKKIVSDFEKEKKLKPDPSRPISEYLRALNDYAKTKIPEGTEILFHKEINVNTREVEYIPYVLSRDALVTGEDLQDAYVGFNNENNQPIVNFQLTPMGSTKFEKATGENVGKYMAIVLDNHVHSAPRIKQKIGGGRALIEMGTAGRASEDVYKDAKDTALVLRSGALPARLQFLEERTIGPSLGKDAIRAGLSSLTFGVVLVFGLLILYYRGSGVIAVTALLVNLFLIVAVMAAFEGTLTLPGLAGLTLSLAMAVDANVLIFEQTRDGLRHGKPMKLALHEGYDQAFSAIFDANVTVLIASLVLLSFGYGPIRGFAVTMLIGNVMSLYTNVFMTRVIFDHFVFAREKTSFSI